MSKEPKEKRRGPAQPILHFYCYICKDYELKTSPHFEEQKRKFAARRKAEAEGKKWPA